MDSIVQKEKKCFYCGTIYGLECHHVFGGNPNRKRSEEDGLKVWLCHQHHNEPPDGVHFNKYRMAWLHDYAQRKAMEYYGWSVNDFIQRYGKNYLIDTEDF